MALTFTLQDFWDDGKRIHVIGNIAAAGAYVTNGMTLDISGIGPAGVPVAQNPLFAAITSNDGYGMAFIPGTLLTNAKVLITSTADTQAAASTLPAGVSGDTNIQLYMIFKKLQ